MDQKTKVEERYVDVLQNIELAITIIYKDHPGMSDYDVMRMLEALIDAYVAEKIGRPQRNFSLSDVEKVLLASARGMCEWRMGRGKLGPNQTKEKNITISEVKTADEIIVCLKRILKSVKKWNKSNGRQGYLNFIARYVGQVWDPPRRV